jgi:vancomycin resistance protein VanW
MLRRLKDVDMYLQENKIVNLRIAARHLDGLVLQPGETFSLWRRVGRPTARKGYLPGLVLENGRISKGIGGGLCQLGNLIYWMALHSPLTVTERWRHSYDVFPDEQRTLPFGSGATLAYNYIDLQFRNDTNQPIQLHIWLDATHLHGSLRSAQSWPEHYAVIEQGHHIRHEPWGGYSRHNRLVRQVFGPDGALLREETAAENHALLMYQPFIEG